MEDGLYLNGVWVCDADNIALTLQGKDLQQPSTLQISYSSDITLPDTVAIRQLTESAEGPDSLSKWPYRKIPAYVRQNGNVTFQGVAVMQQFEDGWEIELLDENTNVFDKLDRSVRTATLERHDFQWTAGTINNAKNSTSGVCFPLIDYGTISGGEVPSDTIFPALYVHTLIDELLAQEGYTLTGDLRADKLYKALALPFVEQDPTNRSDEWVKDRQARVTVLTIPSDKLDVTLGNKGINRIQKYVVDNRPLEAWSQGKARNFKTDLYSYVCDVDMRLTVQAFQQFTLKVDFGSVELFLQVEKNGKVVAQDYFTKGALYNSLRTVQDSLNVDAEVNCKAGDQVRIRFIAKKRSAIVEWELEVFNTPEQSWANFVPDNKVHFGDKWPVAQNLPDITGLQLLKTIAFACSGTWKASPTRKTLTFEPLNDAVNNTGSAVDWSRKVDESRASYKPRVDGYGIINRMKWKELDGVTTGFGDGAIGCDAETLPADVTLFDLPFAAVENGTANISGYGEPLKIETRLVTRDGSGNVTINKKNTTPRLVLVDSVRPIDVQTKVFDALDQVVTVTVSLCSAWFSKRPVTALRAETAFCLCFDKVDNLTSEVTLISRYYAGLKRILRRPRTLQLRFLLDSNDIAGLDLNKPVYVGKVRVGNMYLNGGYYYLNKIDGWLVDQPCNVTLIAL